MAASAQRLHQAQSRFSAGFCRGAVRITTQPFMQYAGGLRSKARSCSRGSASSAPRLVRIDIGPAVLDDRPDRAHWRCSRKCAWLVAELSMIIAGDDGIHWNTVRAAASVAQVAARSGRSEGTFAFAAIAMLPPGSPFFPGSPHQPAGRFAVGPAGGVAAGSWGAPGRARGDASWRRRWAATPTRCGSWRGLSRPPAAEVLGFDRRRRR
jgi:hypothetical protein